MVARGRPGPANRGSAIADLLTPTEIRRLLHAYGLAPRRAAGQHFVVDQNVVRRIVAAAGIAPDDVVLEVGAGLGSLTLALAEAAARVVALEIDSGLVRALHEVVGDRENVEVVHGDALRVELGSLVAGGQARLVANLPYNVATPVVIRALCDPAITDLFVMVQREVGERWSARCGDPSWSGVTVKIGLLAHAEIVFSVPKTVFYPVPSVDSVMVRMRRRPEAPPPERRERLFWLVDAAFAHRRKTLRNNLRVLLANDALEYAARQAGIDLAARAETLEVADVERLEAAIERA